MNSKTINKFSQYLIFGFLALLTVAALFNMHYGIDSTNLMRVFSTDESWMVEILIDNVSNNDLNPRGFYFYGFFYHTVTYGIISLFELLDYSTDTRFIAYTFRFVSLASYLLLLFIVYKILFLLSTDRISALCAVLFLASAPNFYHWAQLVKPDLLQVLLLTLASYIAFSKHSYSHALTSAFIAGVAFGTKYSAIFISPFLPLPFLLSFFDHKIRMRSKLNMKDFIIPASIILGMSLLFLTAWLITNPYVLDNFQEFRESMTQMKKNLGTGRDRVESTNSLLWFTRLYGELGLAGSILITTGIINLIVSMVIKNKTCQEFLSKPFNIVIFTMLLYITFSWLYIMLELNTRRTRYFFHILPFLVILGFTGISKMINEYIKGARLKSIVYFVIVICIIPGTVHTIKSMNWCSKKYEHQYIKATEFIEKRYGYHEKILADDYSYNSPNFIYFIPAWPIEEKEIQQLNPTFLILNKNLSGRYSWKKEGTKFNDLKFELGAYEESQTIYDLHLKLFSQNSQFAVVYEDTDVVVLKKKLSTDKTDRLLEK